MVRARLILQTVLTARCVQRKQKYEWKRLEMGDLRSGLCGSKSSIAVARNLGGVPIVDSLSDIWGRKPYSRQRSARFAWVREPVND